MQKGANKLWQQEASKGLFRVRSTYKLLKKDNQQVINWPWRQIWKVKIPILKIVVTQYRGPN